MNSKPCCKHQPPAFSRFPPMPQGKAVIEAIQWIVVCLSGLMSPVDIAACMDLSKHKVRDILAYFNRNGDVQVSVHEHARIQISLQDEDIQVWVYLLSSMYLTHCNSIFSILLTVHLTYTWTNYG